MIFLIPLTQCNRAVASGACAPFVSLEDLMIRYHRMKGNSTIMGSWTDHAGIATQLQVKNMLAPKALVAKRFVGKIPEYTLIEERIRQASSHSRSAACSAQRAGAESGLHRMKACRKRCEKPLSPYMQYAGFTVGCASDQLVAWFDDCCIRLRGGYSQEQGNCTTQIHD